MTRSKRIKKLWEDVKDEWNQKYYDFLKRHWDRLDHRSLSHNSELPLRIVDEFPDEDWDWTGISKNSELTPTFVEKYPNKPWYWFYISRHSNTKLDYIEEHPDKPWNWVGVSCNPNTTINFIDKYPDKPWNWILISQCLKFTMEDVKARPDNPWDFSMFSRNPKIKYTGLDKPCISSLIRAEDIEFRPSIHMNPRRYDIYSSDKNLEMEIIDRYPDRPWNWRDISRNTFQGEKQRFIERKLREYMAAYKIKEAWANFYFDPSTEICKNRLMREHQEMTKEHQKLFR